MEEEKDRQNLRSTEESPEINTQNEVKSGVSLSSCNTNVLSNMEKVSAQWQGWA